MIVNHNTDAVKEMLRNIRASDIVGIRGLNLVLEDIGFEQGNSVETMMWNPIHYAVYFQNLELVKFFVKDMRINLAITAPKSYAENEKDPVNTN